ncbi:MAG: anhydro-N-acetylmuramic acid kinase, partial [Candidatus Krumholzibacteriota bacterium]|nr:anhydro-N-acetylmuramic acid kinase [Candidatus Krumholzibacteriota bacterium]
DPEAVDFIGSHGQTVAHVPPAPQTTISGTLQLGSPGAIAALTGVTTVGDFRSGDMALGGHGAPLAPGADFLLRRSDQHNRVILNIGGIANVTFLPRACTREDVIAFDTGPGNMLVDALYRALFGGGTGFDRDGAAAAAGEVSDEVLASAMSHAYFELPPPKSTGQGEFGTEYAWQFQSVAEEKTLGRSDSLATAAALTAESIAAALEKFIMKNNVIDEIFVTGGGVHNKAIMSRLRQRLEGSGDIRPIDELGIPADAKEAVDFALLARETIMARANVLTAVTGASRALSLGTIAFGGTA